MATYAPVTGGTNSREVPNEAFSNRSVTQACTGTVPLRTSTAASNRRGASHADSAGAAGSIRGGGSGHRELGEHPLREVRRAVLAATAWTTWVLAASLAAMATLGFVELHTADTAAARGATVATSTALVDQRSAAITAAQLALSTATKQREAELLAKWKADQKQPAAS